MIQTSETNPFREGAPGVYPPSFCDWRLLLAVMVITEVSVILASLGREGMPVWKWIALTSLYAQWMALFCAAGLCVMQAWFRRMSTRGAWIAAWLITVLLSLAFSYAAWRTTTFMAPGVAGYSAAMFVFESVWSVALVSIVFFRYLVIRGRWRSQIVAQADARVQALQARIQPHFLFNSLNTIASLIHDRPDSAETATLDLADIFRGSMRRADQPIAFAEEMKLGSQYLAMEKRRLGDRLVIDWNVEEVPGDASILPLMLQPLLENAVGHGIQSRPEGGTVRVYGRTEGDQVVLTIGNPVSDRLSNMGGSGMAIRNIRERLNLAFGSRASLVTSREADEFFAVLSLPYVKHTDR